MLSDVWHFKTIFIIISERILKISANCVGLLETFSLKFIIVILFEQILLMYFYVYIYIMYILLIFCPLVLLNKECLVSFTCIINVIFIMIVMYGQFSYKVQWICILAFWIYSWMNANLVRFNICIRTVEYLFEY